MEPNLIPDYVRKHLPSNHLFMLVLVSLVLANIALCGLELLRWLSAPIRDRKRVGKPGVMNATQELFTIAK
jgi:hypothetical protein